MGMDGSGIIITITMKWIIPSFQKAPVSRWNPSHTTQMFPFTATQTARAFRSPPGVRGYPLVMVKSFNGSEVEMEQPLDIEEGLPPSAADVARFFSLFFAMEEVSLNSYSMVCQRVKKKSTYDLWNDVHGVLVNQQSCGIVDDNCRL